MSYIKPCGKLNRIQFIQYGAPWRYSLAHGPKQEKPSCEPIPTHEGQGPILGA